MYWFFLNFRKLSPNILYVHFQVNFSLSSGLFEKLSEAGSGGGGVYSKSTLTFFQEYVTLRRGQTAAKSYFRTLERLTRLEVVQLYKMMVAGRLRIAVKQEQFCAKEVINA